METSWTIESLRDFLIRLIEINDKRYDQRFADAKTAVDIAFNAQKESVNSALLSADRAVLKAESAAEKRFDSVNEFRATLADQQRMLMPRAEAEIIFKSLADRIQVLSDDKKTNEGQKKGSGEMIAWFIAALGVGTAIISLILRR